MSKTFPNTVLNIGPHRQGFAIHRDLDFAQIYGTIDTTEKRKSKNTAPTNALIVSTDKTLLEAMTSMVYWIIQI